MSHVTDLKLRITDLDALAEACEQLGLELQLGKETYAWWGRYVGDSDAYGQHTPDKMGRCDHAIRIKGDRPKSGSGGPWEIGVVKEGDGYQLYYDTYGGAGRRLTERIGAQADRLRREYACAVVTRRAKATLAKKGYRLTREDLPAGRIRLRLRKR